MNDYKQMISLGLRTWVGLNDIAEEGVYRWSYNNQENGYAGFAANEPNGNVYENCARFFNKAATFYV